MNDNDVTTASAVPTVAFGGKTYRLAYHDLLPPLPPETYARIKTNIRRLGHIPTAIIDDGADVIIDGGNRLKIAAELKLKPADLKWVHLYGLSDEDKERLATEFNADRRHLTEEQLQEYRDGRKQAEFKLRRAGKSTREIAEIVGVSQSQVVRDLNDGTEPRGSVEPADGKVKGKDGKTRPATSKKAEKGTVPKAEANGVHTPATETEEPPPDASESEQSPPAMEDTLPTHDKFGIRLEGEAATAFEAEPLFREATRYLRKAAKLISRAAHLPGGVFLRPHLEFEVTGTGTPKERSFYRSAGIQQVLSDLKHCAPHAAGCPYCLAEQRGRSHPDCKACSGAGFTPLFVFKRNPPPDGVQVLKDLSENPPEKGDAWEGGGE